MNITEQLALPFEESQIKWKPAVVSGNKAMAIAYIDARCVMDRLDEVVGVDGWQDSYKAIENGTVICSLVVKFGDTWVTKSDVGGESEQNDEGDRAKAAFSDALKRAAVKFGIGRYLYRFPAQWVDYDPQKKRFAQKPILPAFAIRKASYADPKDVPVQPGLISEKQYSEIETLVEKIHRAEPFDTVKFFEWLSKNCNEKISTFSEIPASRFRFVVTGLQSKLKKLGVKA